MLSDYSRSFIASIQDNKNNYTIDMGYIKRDGNPIYRFVGWTINESNNYLGYNEIYLRYKSSGSLTSDSRYLIENWGFVANGESRKAYIWYDGITMSKLVSSDGSISIHAIWTPIYDV